MAQDESGACFRTPRLFGFLMAFLTLVADQGSKLYLLFIHVLSLNQPIVIAPFLDFMTVWNRGVSYGLLQQHTEWGRWGLVGVSVIAAGLLMNWLRRANGLWLGAALGLIIGGAIGNAIDRVAYGAVFDFIHVHVGSFSWYVFNVADAAIVAGVGGLVYDAFVLEKRRLSPSP